MRSLPLLLALAVAPLAVAQSLNVDARPASGTMQLEGAETSRLTVPVRAVDLVPEDVQTSGCYGYVDASSPDAVLQWGGGNLQIRVEGDFDPTLVVALPDGEWACIDDFDGPLPVLDMVGAPAGRYAVWVGSFGPDPGASTSTLIAGPMPPRPVLDVDATPLSGILNAPGGFEAGEGTLELAIQAGGSDRASAVDPEMFCAGYVDAAQPTASVLYSASGGTGRLAIGLSTGVDIDSMTEDDMMMADFDDLVLMVVGPDGQLYCNDDYLGPDPLVVIDGPESGTYSVWAGTYSRQDNRVDATLTVAETAEDIDFGDFGDMDFEDFGGFEDVAFSPYSSGTYVSLDLEAVPSVRLVGGDDLSGSVETQIRPDSPNPVQGDACRGFIERSATVALELSGDGPFALRASSDGDLTMTVMTPSGDWLCSDDADELDPGIQIDGSESGVYHVWIGTFSDNGMATDVTVSVAPGVVESAGIGGFGTHMGGADQVIGTYSGAQIRPGGGAAELSLTGDIGGATQRVMAGGPILNPVDGASCQGFVSESPSLSVFSPLPLDISVSSPTGEDLTLIVHAPDGTWTCSDDIDGGRFPGAASVGTGGGEYSIWVGTFSRRTEPSAAIVDVTVVSPEDQQTPPPGPEVIRG